MNIKQLFSKKKAEPVAEEVKEWTGDILAKWFQLDPEQLTMTAEVDSRMSAKDFSAKHDLTLSFSFPEHRRFQGNADVTKAIDEIIERVGTMQFQSMENASNVIYASIIERVGHHILEEYTHPEPGPSYHFKEVRNLDQRRYVIQYVATYRIKLKRKEQ